jgi:Fe-S-cluster-containing hydrogenase component 2
MLESYDGIKIRSSLYEREIYIYIYIFSAVRIQTRKFQSHINLCYNGCWYHIMEYKSHQANAKGQKKKRIIFRCWDSNLKISKPYKFVLQQMLVSYDGIKIRSRLYKRAKKKNSAAKIQFWKFQSHINLCYNRCWYHMMEYISHQTYAKGKNKKNNYFHYRDSNPQI